MPLRLANDIVDIQKQNGESYTNLKAQVSSNTIIMEANGILVEPNDLIIRKMSNGAIETYKVIDPNFFEKVFGFPPHYQMKVKKLGIPEAEQEKQQIIFNISGNNNKINHQSTDNSITIKYDDNRISDYIYQMREIIQNNELSNKDKEESLEIVAEVENQFKSGNPKKTVITGLLNSIGHIANISTIATAIKDLL